MKIIEKLMRLYDANKTSTSFEYYPPGDRSKWPAFYKKIERMSQLKPDFIDVTWGTGKSTSLNSLEISQHIQKITGIETMMHLTCTGLTKDELYKILKDVKDSNIHNIMALRGDKPADTGWAAPKGGLSSAAELVDFMRDAFKDHFCISVAAYPEGHRDDGSLPDPEYYKTQAYWDELHYLKSKLSAGADFVVTQLCFDLERLRQFKQDCRKIGIVQPIVPGILPIHNIQVYRKIEEFSASVPQALKEAMADLKDEEVPAFGVSLLREQLRQLRADGFFAVHLYTLNFERVIRQALQ